MALGILTTALLGFLQVTGYLIVNQSVDQHRVVASVLAENVMEDLNTRLGSDSDLGGGSHTFYFDENEIPTPSPGTYKANYKVRKNQGYYTISLTVSWKDFGPTHSVFLQESRPQN